MAGPRDPHVTPRPAPPRPVDGAAAAAPRPTRSRPDPNPMRLMFGLVGLASATALVAAMAPSIAPAPLAETAVVRDAAAGVSSAQAAVAAPVPRITRYVVLAPGQTPPPGASVVAQPQPTPIVKLKVVTRTRQSGQP